MSFPIAAIAKIVPWKSIAISLVPEAGEILKDIIKKVGSGRGQLVKAEARIKELEDSQIEQAKFDQKLAEQIQILSQRLATLAIRLKIALVVMSAMACAIIIILIFPNV